MKCQVGGEHQRVSRDHQEGHHEADLIMEAIAPLMTRNRSTLGRNRRTTKRGKSSAKFPHGLSTWTHSQRKCQLLVWSMVIGTRSLHRYSTTGSWRTSLSCLTTSGEGLTATAFVLIPVRTKEETLSIQINNPSRSTSMRKPVKGAALSYGILDMCAFQRGCYSYILHVLLINGSLLLHSIV